VSSDPIAMCELLVGLGEVTVLAVTDTAGGLRIEVETRAVRPMCSNCEVPVVVKDRDMVELTDLPCFGKPVWRWLLQAGLFRRSRAGLQDRVPPAAWRRGAGCRGGARSRSAARPAA
jgi:hypothetical protein